MYHASRNQTHYACNAHKVCRMGNCKAMAPNIHNEIQLTMHAEHPKRIAKAISRQACLAKSNPLCMHREEVQSKAHCNTVV